MEVQALHPELRTSEAPARGTYSMGPRQGILQIPMKKVRTPQYQGQVGNPFDKALNSLLLKISLGARSGY